jgi:hypothetical protein
MERYSIQRSPSADVCEFGGITHLWAVRYNSGGALKKGVLRGKALIHFHRKHRRKRSVNSWRKGMPEPRRMRQLEFRRTAPIPGLASTEKPQISIPPKPMRTILHIRER